MPLVHKHLILRLLVDKPPTDPKYIAEEWMPNLVEDIGMKILSGPFAVYSLMEGNKGLTAITIIETSHIAMHVWDEENLIQLDVYTCSSLDPVVVLASLMEFGVREASMKYLDREHGLVEIPVPIEEDIINTGA